MTHENELVFDTFLALLHASKKTSAVVKCRFCGMLKVLVQLLGFCPVFIKPSAPAVFMCQMMLLLAKLLGRQQKQRLR